MEREPAGPEAAGAARERLRAARQAHDVSVRRCSMPAGLISALSTFCGVLTVPPRYRGPGHALAIIVVVWSLVELMRMSARHQWRPMRSWPKPKWGVSEVTLICVAALVGSLVGPHVLAGYGHSALASWGLGVAVAVVVAACLFGAYASYRGRAARVWPQ